MVVMNALRIYLNGLPVAQQAAYAARCGTTLGYLRKVISTNARVDVALLIKLDRESKGAVPVEQLRADADWPYLAARCSLISNLPNA